MRSFWLTLGLLGCAPAATDTAAGSGADPDTAADSGSAGDSGVIGHPPSRAQVAIDPAVPPAGVDLAAVIVTAATDPDGDALTYRYAWTEDGAARAELTEATVPGAETVDGEVWAVSVIATDGVNDGSPATASVTVGNPPPVAFTLSFDPAEPVRGDDLTLVFTPTPSDPNGDPLTQTITWYRDGVEDPLLADSTTVDGRSLSGGTTLRAVASESDGYNAPVVAEVSVTIVGEPPSLSHPEISPATPVDDDDLVVTATAIDPDGGTPTLSYAWFRDGVAAADVGDVDTVPAAATTVGETWYVVVTASDGTDATADTSDSVEISALNGRRIVRNLTATIAPDGSTVEGTWQTDLLANTSYGAGDCTLLWTFVGSDSPAACPSCDYSFKTTTTLDPSSVIRSGTYCSRWEADGTGDLRYTTGSGYFESSNLFGYYGDVMSFTGTNTRSYTYGGTRTYVDDYSVSSTVDAAGYTTIYAYEYFLRTY